MSAEQAGMAWGAQSPAMMSLEDLLTNYRDGDEHGWVDEFDWLWSHHEGKMDRLANSIQERGIQEPIVLGYDGRVWDGHHRLAAADRLGLQVVPIRYVDPALSVPKRMSKGDDGE